MATYETDDLGVRLKLVRLKRTAYFVGGPVKAQVGAVGRLASEDRGRCVVNFDRPENDHLYIALDGGQRRIQIVDALDLEDV